MKPFFKKNHNSTKGSLMSYSYTLFFEFSFTNFGEKIFEQCVLLHIIFSFHFVRL